MSPLSGLPHYTKTFDSVDALKREQAGHIFLRQYGYAVPDIKLTECKDKLPSLAIARVDYNDAQIVTDALAEGKTVMLRELFTQAAKRAITYGKFRKANGGTVLFYLNRIERLAAPDLVEAFTQHATGMVVGSTFIEPDAALLPVITEHISRFETGYCIPSQGDFHERNICTNGYLIDFEAAGWNLLAGDIATFIWHTLFAGSYFGPQYARWATHLDKQKFQASPRQLKLSDGILTLCLSSARTRFLKDYLEAYTGRFDVIDTGMESDICAAIAFRMLTVFPPQDMQSTDQAMCYALAAYFMQACSLTEKLTGLVKNLSGATHTRTSSLLTAAH